MSAINKLNMAMSAARRQSDRKKQRKKVRRTMKRLLKVIEGHAWRYRQLLDEQWQQTDWMRLQAEVVSRVTVWSFCRSIPEWHGECFLGSSSTLHFRVDPWQP